MIRILVDTATWRHWFDYKRGEKFDVDLKKEIIAFDKIYYEIVCPNYNKFRFLYNALIEIELPDNYIRDFEEIKASGLLEKIVIPCSRGDGIYRNDGSLRAGGNYGGSLREFLNMYGHDHEIGLKESWPDFSQSNRDFKKVSFKIRDYTIATLEKAGIPTSILEKLQTIQNAKFVGEKRFMMAVQKIMGDECIEQYKELILKNAFIHTEERRKEFDVEHLESALEAMADYFITTDKHICGRLDNIVASHNHNNIIELAQKICKCPSKALLQLRSIKDINA